jgi:hypothetical protein
MLILKTNISSASLHWTALRKAGATATASPALAGGKLI